MFKKAALYKTSALDPSLPKTQFLQPEFNPRSELRLLRNPCCLFSRCPVSATLKELRVPGKGTEGQKRRWGRWRVEDS